VNAIDTIRELGGDVTGVIVAKNEKNLFEE
jgi:hypothetical protein